MKTKSIILLVLTCIVYSCATAGVGKQKRNVGSFNKIASSGGIDVYFTYGNSCSVEIDTDSENLDKIDAYVRNGSLILERKNNERFKRNTIVKVYVSAPIIEAIAVSGGADFYAKELSNKSELSIAASGGADCNIDKLNANICNLALSGGSDCDIKQAKIDKLNIASSGGSDADINVTNADEINASASGGSDLRISGKTKTISIHTSGGSDVDIKYLSYESISTNKVEKRRR